MTSDLERDLQLALHEGVEHVTAERLRHLDPPSARQRNRPRFAGPLLAAACVGVLALTVTILSADRHAGTETGGGRSGTLTSLIGTSWALSTVRQAGNTVQIPQRLSAGVTFGHRGALEAQDGTNILQGTYALHGPRTMYVQAGPATAIGYVGHDPGRLAAISGIGALFRTVGRADARNPVTVQHRGDRLTLSTNGYVLTLTDPTPVATSSAPAPASASTSR